MFSRLCAWWLRWRYGIRPFRPFMAYYREIELTTIMLEDTATVWSPLERGRAHFVDLGYDMETGRLVGVNVWADVSTCGGLDEVHAHAS